MFGGLKDKMTRLYDDMKTKIARNEEENNEEEQPIQFSQKETPKPVIQRPNKPQDYSMNSSLINSQLNESDFDMRRLDNFNLNISSKRSFEDQGAKRVAYYNRKDESRNDHKGNYLMILKYIKYKDQIE